MCYKNRVYCTDCVRDRLFGLYELHCLYNVSPTTQQDVCHGKKLRRFVLKLQPPGRAHNLYSMTSEDRRNIYLYFRIFDILKVSQSIVFLTM